MVKLGNYTGLLYQLRIILGLVFCCVQTIFMWGTCWVLQP